MLPRMSDDTSTMLRVAIDTISASLRALGIGAILLAAALGRAAGEVAGALLLGDGSRRGAERPE